MAYENETLEAIEERLIKLRSGIDVAIGLAERVCHYYDPSASDRERLLNALRDVRTELREMIDG